MHGWQGVVLFCFPNGISLQRPAPPNEPLPTFFTFVATGVAGVQLYGHCLTFYERLTATQEAYLDMGSSPAPTDPACAASDVVATAAHGRPAWKGSRQEAIGSTYFAPKCLVVLSRWCFPEFREFLTELYRTSLTRMSVPLERVIGNFLSEVPLPPAGKVAVQYMINTHLLVFRRPPANKRLSSLGLHFLEVFECLDIDNIVCLFKCLLAERQVSCALFN